MADSPIFTQIFQISHLSNIAVPTQNCVKGGNVLSTLFFNLTVVYAIREVKEKQERLK
jgi:hypothetical protein